MNNKLNNNFKNNKDLEFSDQETMKNDTINKNINKKNTKQKSYEEQKKKGKTGDGALNKDYQKENKNKESVETNYKEQISSLREEKLRLLAEMENLRKRSNKEKLDTIKYGSTNLARDILSLDDNLTRALENLPEEENRSESIINLIDGLKMIKKEFISTLAKYGVKKIEAMKKKFDHNYHQAMFEVETAEDEEGIIIQEIQSGYTMHDRLLRPTLAGVSKKIKKKEKS